MRKNIGNALRMKILARDLFRCVYCGNNVVGGAVLQVDHIIPVVKGGTNDEHNLTTACRECNMGKFDRTMEQLEELRLMNAKEKLASIQEVNALKEDMKDIVRATISDSRDYCSPETEVFIELLGYEYSEKESKALQAIVKREGVIELSKIFKGVLLKNKPSPSYVEGVIRNYKLENLYPTGYNVYRGIKTNYIDKLHLKFPLSSKQVSEVIYLQHMLCKYSSYSWEDRIKDNIDIVVLKYLINIMKRYGMYNKINELVYSVLICKIDIYDVIVISYMIKYKQTVKHLEDIRGKNLIIILDGLERYLDKDQYFTNEDGNWLSLNNIGDIEDFKDSRKDIIEKLTS